MGRQRKSLPEDVIDIVRSRIEVSFAEPMNCLPCPPFSTVHCRLHLSMQGDNKIILAVVPADVDDLQGAAKSLNEARRADPDGMRTIGDPSVLATSWACLP